MVRVIGRSLVTFLIFLLVITVNSFGQKSWVIPDFCQLSEDVSLRTRILHNDNHNTNPIDTSSLIVSRSPRHGTTVIEYDLGTIRYTPNPDFFGLDSFFYTVCNFRGECQEAMVTLIVHAINDAPTAVNDLDTVFEDSWIDLDVMKNDGDLADNAPLGDFDEIQIVEYPRHGSLTVENKHVRYQPYPNYFGNDYFRYYICDESLCDTAMARIHVKPVNDSPHAREDHFTTFEQLLVIMDVLANDDDSLDLELPAASGLSVEGLLQPAHGFLYLDIAVGLVVYLPDQGFIGTDSFEYQFCDQGPNPILCDTALVTIEVEAQSNLYNLTVQSTTSVISPESKTARKPLHSGDRKNLERLLIRKLESRRLDAGIYQIHQIESGFKIIPYPMR